MYGYTDYIWLLFSMTVNYMTIETKGYRLDIYLWFIIIRKENHGIKVSLTFLGLLQLFTLHLHFKQKNHYKLKKYTIYRL